MLRDGFIRFCDDPEIACYKTEAELGKLRMENAQLRADLRESQRRERAAVECIDELSEIAFRHAGDSKCSGYITIRIGEWRYPVAGKGEAE